MDVQGPQSFKKKGFLFVFMPAFDNQKNQHSNVENVEENNPGVC